MAAVLPIWLLTQPLQADTQIMLTAEQRGLFADRKWDKYRCCNVVCYESKLRVGGITFELRKTCFALIQVQ